MTNTEAAEPRPEPVRLRRVRMSFLVPSPGDFPGRVSPSDELIVANECQLDIHLSTVNAFRTSLGLRPLDELSIRGAVMWFHEMGFWWDRNVFIPPNAIIRYEVVDIFPATTATTDGPGATNE